ncbi:MAG: 4Fe-4S dicluster domain-containing protein [Myxococcales bacterium]|nr:4Fe-4S dicluster domain-containing protein [Myxococcales bacterium]
MNYGFVIDTRSCIGCHACSTACKSENEVPLGVNRTWVKYTETGRFPDTRRAFQVTRCNHCANPPCVRICPVTAMYQRKDGIVEFDSSVCIGCKACLQACPYDAIYIDPDSGTAAKCHFCGHRVENGLEPACVVVCPTHSIIAGDMDDPKSEIARVLARNATTVRKPEQGTAPKLFYIDGTDVAMHPTATDREPAGLMYTDVLDAHGRHRGPEDGYADATFYQVRLKLDDGYDGGGPGERGEAGSHARIETGARTSASGAPIRDPGEQGVPSGGPIQIQPGRMAGHMVSQVANTVFHKVPWHWQVPAYTVSKSVGTGAFLLVAALGPTGAGFRAPEEATLVIGLVGILATLLTTALLVGDLERPERFLRILTRPQWRSWLTRGAFLLVGFSIVSTLLWVAQSCLWLGWCWPGGEETLALAGLGLAVLTIPLAIGAAVYTAFLFAQCEGRDLWQSPLLPAHMLVHSVMMGGAVVGVVTVVVPNAGLAAVAPPLLGAMLVVDLFFILAGEFGVAHASEAAARAAREISHGKYSRQFWVGAIGIGHVAPLLLLAASAGWASMVGSGAEGPRLLVALAGLLACVGLYLYEHAFVMAPQEIPNS